MYVYLVFDRVLDSISCCFEEDLERNERMGRFSIESLYFDNQDDYAGWLKFEMDETFKTARQVFQEEIEEIMSF